MVGVWHLFPCPLFSFQGVGSPRCNGTTSQNSRLPIMVMTCSNQIPYNKSVSSCYTRDGHVMLSMPLPYHPPHPPCTCLHFQPVSWYCTSSPPDSSETLLLLMTFLSGPNSLTVESSWSTAEYLSWLSSPWIASSRKWNAWLVILRSVHDTIIFPDIYSCFCCCCSSYTVQWMNNSFVNNFTHICIAIICPEQKLFIIICRE